MPGDHSSWFGDHQGIRPLRPGSPQSDPEQPVDPGQASALAFPFQYTHLITQSKDFQRMYRDDFGRTLSTQRERRALDRTQ